MNTKIEKARLIKKEDRQESLREEKKAPVQSEPKVRRTADMVVREWIESRREQRQPSAHARFAALFAE